MIRPLKPKVRTILKVAIALAVVAFVLFIWVSARPVPMQVRLTCTGFTNSLTVTLACFCVSNAGRCSVFGGGVENIEIKNKPHDSRFGFVNLTWRGDLKPGEFKTFSLSTPQKIKREPFLRVDNRGRLVSAQGTNLEPWRVTLYYSKVDWRQRLVRNPSSILQTVLRLVPAKWLEPHQIEVHSDWISGPGLMPAATDTANASPK